MRPVEPAFLVTCEHASNAVPAELEAHFAGERAALVSHRGWDPGALDVARPLARRLRAPLVAGRHTRLLVDLNRSPGNPAVFAAITRALPTEERTRLIERHHRPHWARVRDAVDRLSASGRRVVHVAVHSFAPTLGGVERAIDVGLLYDPHRGSERALCRSWRDALAAADPSLRIRRNAPYRGVSDGLPTALRRALPEARYVGIELELNQSLVPARPDLAALLATSLRAAVASARAALDGPAASRTPRRISPHSSVR